MPERESEHAYVRHADGITYVCPWQTRLRCLLAYGRMLSGVGALLPGTVPADEDDQAMAALAQLEDVGPTAPRRLHILASVWTVPLAWFVPFAATERWLSLGPGRDRPSARATASAMRALVYTTPMSHARRRVARGLAALAGCPPDPASPRTGETAWEPSRAEAELAEIGHWLEEFHPYSLVELDYGGLVYLVSDDALSGDQSVAEIRAAIDGVAIRRMGTRRRHVYARAQPVARVRGIRAGELNAPGPRRIVAGQYSRIRRDATISIARITLSDSDRRSNWASRYRNFAPGGRRVTAGDGNMVSVGHIGHPRQAPHGAPGNTRNAGSQHWSRRRGHTYVRTYTRGRAAVDARGGRHDVSCRPQDRHTMGEGRKTDLDPHAGGTPALPGD